ncbi:allophanate hydrolase [Leifsonia sp. Root227]|uniref:5-oxoprolinase subunit PxpB n=1 Tax=unclassified Leifsonia TaxID=2663824 RepID=UPI0006FBAEDF|nr:5-oxoprolinase subunit PxpB [Leifsonia sp. Root227]KRC49913.1 allophanate hydrolase [Leifsonia sp. Root227]
MTVSVLQNGDRGLLAELDDLDAVLALYRALERTRPAGVIDLVPAARTIGVTVDPSVLPLSVATNWLAHTVPEPPHAADARVVEVPVRYDGDDLAEVAALLGMRPADVVALHTASPWLVAFCGFAPGFGYLVTDHERLVVPRRATPRTAVPAGAVGLAGEFSGVYPRSSPGGWQLIGTTDATIWDASAETPALLSPGTAVRFVEAS